MGNTRMALFSRIIFGVVHWMARRGLRDDEQPVAGQKKNVARRTGVHGETYAYWYLRRHGYIFIAKNYMPRGGKGELDLVAHDGETLAFVEVRTRTLMDGRTALPELSVTPAKQHVLIRTAHRFLAERRVGNCPCRFDVLAIDNAPGKPPVVRLHKDAFSPQIHRT
jgi:putative endonuclease